jgi:hypothetical protein
MTINKLVLEADDTAAAVATQTSIAGVASSASASALRVAGSRGGAVTGSPRRSRPGR